MTRKSKAEPVYRRDVAFGKGLERAKGVVAQVERLEPVAERGDAGEPRALSAVVEGVIFGDSPV